MYIPENSKVASGNSKENVTSSCVVLSAALCKANSPVSGPVLRSGIPDRECGLLLLCMRFPSFGVGYGCVFSTSQGGVPNTEGGHPKIVARNSNARWGPSQQSVPTLQPWYTSFLQYRFTPSFAQSPTCPLVCCPPCF